MVIDLMFLKEADQQFIQYLVFQNYYTSTVSIKQYMGTGGANMREEMKNDKKWVTVLSNYVLMVDPHSESDAQNWHIIGMDLVRLIFAHCFLLRFCSSMKTSDGLD